MQSSVRPAFLEFCDRLLSGLSRSMLIVAMLSLAVMTFLIGLQVVSRNLFNLGLPWADELARFTGLATVYFTIPLLQYHGRHIAVDVFSSRLSGLPAKVLTAINEMSALLFCGLLLLSFATFLQRAAHFATPAIGMPNWLFYAPPLVGLIVCTLVTVLRLVCQIGFGDTGTMDSSLHRGNIS